ncbi:MAG: hypothetical protein QNJ26_16010 [Desulfobacterales bacterium]|nr:hypothetical protein [Desulfobacterales bacterium]
MEQGPPLPPHAKSDILSQLEFMLVNPDFRAKPQQTALLKYIVLMVLDGKTRDFTEGTLATEVFGRGPDFDPNMDPIVNIQVDLLRRTLIRYYQTVGKNDSVRIDIPPGTYMPEFKISK